MTPDIKTVHLLGMQDGTASKFQALCRALSVTETELIDKLVGDEFDKWMMFKLIPSKETGHDAA